MTRINVVPVTELCDKHLLAEYHEITRVFKLARPCPDAPKEYTLGNGHVKFFYDKLGFITERTKQLIAELSKRGYKVKLGVYNLEYNRAVHLDRRFWNDYTPTPEALEINRARIAERISQFRRPV